MDETAVNLIWPDGSITRGESYREAEDALRATQWREFRTRREFRADMRHRALVWSGVRLPRRRTSRGFIRSLADAGLCMIEES